MSSDTFVPGIPHDRSSMTWMAIINSAKYWEYIIKISMVVHEIWKGKSDYCHLTTFVLWDSRTGELEGI